MKCKETKYRIVALRVNNEPCSSENVHDNERPCYSKAASNEIFHENQVNTLKSFIKLNIEYFCGIIILFNGIL